MTNSTDPDQLASSEANWSGSTLLEGRAYLGLAGPGLKIKLYISTLCILNENLGWPGGAKGGLQLGKACYPCSR